jgi:HEAT repeat protein
MNENLIKVLLQNQDSKSLLKSLEMMREEGSLADLQRVINLLKSEYAEVRKAAVDTAAELILSNLIDHFAQMKSGVRESLGKLLQRLDPNIINRIGSEIYSKDEERRLRTVQVLGLLGQSKKLRELISEIVKDKDIKVRATAVHLLGKLVLGKDMTLVLALLNDQDPRVRANTIEALEDIGNPSAIGLLQRFRGDPSNRIRGNVLKALWKLGFRDIIEDLKAMMINEDPLMRATGAWVIGEIRPDNRELLDTLASCAMDSEKLVRDNVIKAQLKIGGTIVEKYLHYLCEVDEVEEIKKTLK